VNKDVKRPLEGMTVEWLARVCDKPLNLLCMMARDTEALYKPTRRQKKSGGRGYREIDAPKPEYKSILRKTAKVLSSNIKHHPAAHGGVPGRSSFTSARPHCGAKFVVTRDIKDCYPSITTRKLRSALVNIGASPEFAAWLSSIMTVHGRLPQGGPLSSLAVNLYFLRMDDHFYCKARESKGHYGRLTDDFVMSTNSRAKATAFANELDQAVANRHLVINARKRKQKGFLAGDQLKDIHSLITNSRRGLRPKQEHIEKALGLAEYYARRARCANPEDLPYLANLRGRAYGMMYYCKQADFGPASHLKRVLCAADRNVLRMLQRKGLYPHKNKWWVVVSKGQNEPIRLRSFWDKQKQRKSCA